MNDLDKQLLENKDLFSSAAGVSGIADDDLRKLLVLVPGSQLHEARIHQQDDFVED